MKEIRSWLSLRGGGLNLFVPLTLLEKNRNPFSYLITGVFGIALTLIWLQLAIPFLVCKFLPFPKLEDAEIISGKLHIVGKEHLVAKFNKFVPSKYYIVDSANIKHEIFYGLRGDEEQRYGQDYEGIKTKVWFHPLFGVINEESYPTDYLLQQDSKEKHHGPKGPLHKEKTFGVEYAEYREFFERYQSKKSRYLTASLPFWATLLITIYQFVLYRNSKRRADKFTQSAE